MTEPDSNRSEAAPATPFWTRVVRVGRLDVRVLDEVEADPRALLQSLAVVVGAGLARGIFGLSGEVGPGIVGSLAGAVVLWLLSAALLTTVGVGWLHGTSDFREMLRTLGFAVAPLWLLAPAALLGGGGLHLAAGWLLHLWALAAAVVAVRQALDVSTGRALAACALSLGLAIALLVLLGLPFP